MTVEEIYSHYQIPSDDVSDEVVTTNYTKTAIKRMKKQTVALKETPFSSFRVSLCCNFANVSVNRPFTLPNDQSTNDSRG